MMFQVRIKNDTVPRSLAGLKGTVTSQSESSEVVTVHVDGEGSYRYLKRELEEIEE